MDSRLESTRLGLQPKLDDRPNQEKLLEEGRDGVKGQIILSDYLYGNFMVFLQWIHVRDALKGRPTRSMFGHGWSTREINGA